MKKIFALFLAVLLLATLSACREKSITTTEETKESQKTTETEKGTTVNIVDVNANEQPFTQTGEAQESITITQTGADPSTIVVDLGELVTLSVYSERLKSTQLYNEDLHADTIIMRGETVPVTIEANEEGIFYFTDKTTGQNLFKFMVAGTSFT